MHFIKLIAGEASNNSFTGRGRAVLVDKPAGRPRSGAMDVRHFIHDVPVATFSTFFQGQFCLGHIVLAS